MAVLPVSELWTHTSIQTLVDNDSLNVSDMSRYSSSDYLGNYDMECPQGVFIPSYAPTPTLPPVQPGEPGEPGPPGPPVSIQHSIPGPPGPPVSINTVPGPPEPPVSVQHSKTSSKYKTPYLVQPHPRGPPIPVVSIKRSLLQPGKLTRSVQCDDRGKLVHF